MIKALFATDMLSKVGSIATALTALIAVGSLVYTIHSSDQTQMRRAADDIRQQLLLFSHEVETVDRMMEDQMFIALASLGRRIGVELTNQLVQSQEVSSTETFLQFIVKKENEPLKLTIVGETWEKNRSVPPLLSAFDSLNRSSRRLTGVYSLFGEMAHVYAPYNHGISPAEFVKILDNMAILEENGQEIPPSMLPDLLGQVASGKLGKHIGPRKLVQEYIENTVQCAIGLSDKKMLRLAQKRPESTNTHSGDARQLAEFIQKEAGDRRDGSCEEMMQKMLEFEREMKMQNSN